MKYLLLALLACSVSPLMAAPMSWTGSNPTRSHCYGRSNNVIVVPRNYYSNSYSRYNRPIVHYNISAMYPQRPTGYPANVSRGNNSAYQSSSPGPLTIENPYFKK